MCTLQCGGESSWAPAPKETKRQNDSPVQIRAMKAFCDTVSINARWVCNVLARYTRTALCPHVRPSVMLVYPCNMRRAKKSSSYMTRWDEWLRNRVSRSSNCRASERPLSSAGPINALSSWTYLVDPQTRFAGPTPLPYTTYTEFGATSINKILRSLSEHPRTKQSTSQLSRLQAMCVGEFKVK